MFVHREIYSPGGSRLWSAQDGATCPPEVLAEVPSGALRSVVTVLAGGRSETAPISLNDITRECERLRLITREGCLPGFVTVLPPGAFLDKAVEKINQRHAAQLNAVTMQFPLIFDRSAADLSELTSSYESQNRMVRVGGSERLAYAADAGLFSWLRGRELVGSRLPYTIYSPMPVFRRRLSGETDLLTLNQYTLPDLHVLCTREQAPMAYMTILREAAATCRLLFGETGAQFMEISPELYNQYPALARDMARAAGQFTIARYLDRRRRYFSLKGGIDVHSGSVPIMLYNFQWDEINGQRFNIRTGGGENVIIIHSTLAGGWPKVMPLIVGRALAGWTEREIPVGFGSEAVTVLPVTDDDVPAAVRAIEQLKSRGIPAGLGEGGRRSVGSRVHRLRRLWHPYSAVVGRREACREPLALTRISTQEVFGVEAFLTQHRNVLSAVGYGHGRDDRSHVPSRADLPYR